MVTDQDTYTLMIAVVIEVTRGSIERKYTYMKKKKKKKDKTCVYSFLIVNGNELTSSH